MFNRFVILCHRPGPNSARPQHWDLMIEQEAGLRTWALPHVPSVGQTLEAEELPLHRAVYLDYEGAISEGRGEVKRWDEGVYEVLDADERAKPADCSALQFRLTGRRLQAKLIATPTESRKVLPGQRWTLEFAS